MTSSQRRPLVTRKADTREEAIAMARRLLDDASDMVQLHGEKLAVEVWQGDQ